MNPPSDTLAISQGFHYLVYGPDQRIPYIATAFVTLKPVLVKRSEVLGRFMRAMAEAEKILLTDKEFTYKVLGKFLRVTDRKILDASYNTEVKALEPKLEIRPEAIQSILDEVAKIDPRARKVKPEDLIDRRYIDEMEKSGFFDKLWGDKR